MRFGFHALFLGLVVAAGCDCGGNNAGSGHHGNTGGDGGFIPGTGGSGGAGGDPQVDPCDRDADGHDSIRCGGDDCDDMKAAVHPGAVETCDGGLVDDDCDGAKDEGCPCDAGDTRSCYPPGDKDPTRGVGACHDGTETCAEDGVWGDCSDAVVPSEEPDACDAIDQDCDGTADQALINRCGVCGELPTERCQNGFDDDCDGVIDNADFCNVSCQGVDPDAPEAGLACCVADPDGDGPIPPQPSPYSFDCVAYEGLPACPDRPCVDLDGDPLTLCASRCTGEAEAQTCVCGADPGEGGDPVASAGCGYETACNRLDCDGRENQPCYSGPPPTLGVGICRGGSHSCVDAEGGGRAWTACEAEHLPEVEACDNDLDDDCDGLLDEENGVTHEPCAFTRNCDARETCGNGLDDDCDGLADEACAATGDEQACYTGAPGSRNVGACHDGVQSAVGEFWGPCTGDALPGVEVCADGIDSDCDGLGGPDSAEETGCCAPGAEICNALDDDCDGLIDEDLTNACGKCGEPCYVEKFPPDGGWQCENCGLDGTSPGDPNDPDSQCGANQLCLNKAKYDEPYIWIARTVENKVQKVNTTTFQSEFITPVNGWSPSRTAVAVDGSVWVGHRGCQNNLSGCAGNDVTHGNAVHLASDGTLICRADVNGAANGAEKIAVRALTLDQYENAWIGNWDDGVMYQVSGSEVDFTQDPPRCKILRKVDLVWNNRRVKAYGAAVDGRGDLWIATLGSGPTLRINTATGEIVNGITLPFNSYGLAIDNNHNVWFGIWNGQGGVMRLDSETSIVTHPKPPADWDGVALTCEQTSYTRGVAVDFDGNIWVANWSCASVSKYDPDGTHLGTFKVSNGPLGMAVATDGRVWSINYGSSTATVLESDGSFVTTVGGLSQPYSYSDMTGLQLRLVTRQAGSWITTYDSEFALARWYKIGLTASTPAGTHVCLRGRTAGTRAGLATAAYTELVCVPGDPHLESPYTIPIWHPVPGELTTPPPGSLYLGPLETPTELADNRFLQLEIELKGDNGVSPVVDGLEVFWDRP